MTASQAIDPVVDHLLRMAIGNRQVIRLLYRNKERIVEPHDYGIHKGTLMLLAWQVAGDSSGRLPNWRWMQTDLITGIRLTEQHFAGGRPAPSGRHHKWDELFLRVALPGS